MGADLYDSYLTQPPTPNPCPHPTSHPVTTTPPANSEYICSQKNVMLPCCILTGIFLGQSGTHWRSVLAQFMNGFQAPIPLPWLTRIKRFSQGSCISHSNARRVCHTCLEYISIPPNNLFIFKRKKERKKECNQETPNLLQPMQFDQRDFVRQNVCCFM